MRNIIKISALSIIVGFFFSGCLLKDSVNTPEALKGLKSGEFVKFAQELKFNDEELMEAKFQKEFKAMNQQLSAQREFLNSSYEAYLSNKLPDEDAKMEDFKKEYFRDTGKVWQGF
ncbi:hypothetical protein L5F43_12530 [Aliarcobacter butzleri]|uniref:hypothetical protein n=1 Tax=Aliarcobacter butzleri TaxID=28197 RepID=UPI001EDC1BC6|nr:hypothetical protein [Aliarcobacter butzleri]MCG3707299.1 hypothetical protein [Aliarcobacter butzleri]